MSHSVSEKRETQTMVYWKYQQHYFFHPPYKVLEVFLIQNGIISHFNDCTDNLEVIFKSLRFFTKIQTMNTGEITLIFLHALAPQPPFVQTIANLNDCSHSKMKLFRFVPSLLNTFVSTLVYKDFWL